MYAIKQIWKTDFEILRNSIDNYLEIFENSK